VTTAWFALGWHDGADGPFESRMFAEAVAAKGRGAMHRHLTHNAKPMPLAERQGLSQQSKAWLGSVERYYTIASNQSNERRRQTAALRCGRGHQSQPTFPTERTDAPEIKNLSGPVRALSGSR